jgi:hypothetical protein
MLELSNLIPSAKFIALLIISGAVIAIIWDAIERYRNRNKQVEFIPSTPKS